MSSKKCTCGKGYVVWITYPSDPKPVECCTDTIRRYRQQHGKGSFAVHRARPENGIDDRARIGE